VVRPKGHDCQGDKSLGSGACPAEIEIDAKMAIYQTADCAMAKMCWSLAKNQVLGL